MSNEISVVSHNSSNYDNHFIIKELATDFERKFECLCKNRGKYQNFSVPIEKKYIYIDKDGNESVSTISYKIKCIDSVRFISSSQSNLADNFAERIDKVICKDFDIFLNLKVPRTIR